MKVFKYLLMATVIGLLLLPSASFAQDDLEEQTLLMTFIPNIQFAPTYVAIEAGYFADAGYSVSLEYLDEPIVVDLVAADENQFGIVSGEQVILAGSQNRPIVYVYEWFQQFPLGIVYPDTIEADGIEDLADLRFGISGRFGASYIGLTSLLNSAGMVESDISLEEIGFSAPEVFCVGGVEASVIYVNNEPLQISNRAAQGDCGDVTGVNVLPIADVVDLVANGIITNQDMIDNNPEQVAAFVGAFDAGLALTINNPARAYLLSAPYIEGLPLDMGFEEALLTMADEQDEFLTTDPTREEIAASRAAQFETLAEQFDANTLLQYQVLLASIEIWDAEQLGYTDADSWSNMQDTLITLNQLEEAIDLEGLYSNDFLPAGDE